MKNTNSTLNFIKGIAILGIVIIHCKLGNETIDEYAQAFIRFSVPLFYMVSGYYLWKNDEDSIVDSIGPKVKHILKYAVVGSVISCFFLVFIGIVSNGINYGLHKLVNFFDLRSILIWIVFGADPFINILWFLFCQIYSYLLFYFIIKVKRQKCIVYLMGAFLSLHLILGNLIPFIFNFEVNKYCYRNAIVFAFPFMAIGFLIHEKELYILNKISQKEAILCIIFGTLLAIIEVFFIGRREIYIGSILQVLGLFIVSLRSPNLGKSKFFTLIGDKYTIHIYLLHYLIFLCFQILIYPVASHSIRGLFLYKWFIFAVVFALSWMIGALFEKIRISVMENKR